MVKNKLAFATLTIATIVAIVGIVCLISYGGRLTGAATGTATANVSELVDIKMIVSTVDFGLMDVHENDNTTDNNPAPFQIQNNGTYDVNITASATDLWDSSAVPSAYYQVACGTEEHTCTTTFINMPSGATTIITDLDEQTNDDVEVELNVTVPADEPSGEKSSTVTFTASAA